MISKLVLFQLLAFVILVHGQAGSKICLYSNGTILTPLQLKNTDCPKNHSYCMNEIYNYGNFKYNGPASLMPRLGEIAMFLTQDQQGNYDFVTFLNANVTTVVNSTITITGATPTPALLYDDPPPQDIGFWNASENFGTFQWSTQPGFTDGIVVGHINFVNNYCLKTTYTPKTLGAINTISIFSGNVSSPSRLVSLPFTSGQLFIFCQYPTAISNVTNVQCPGMSTGSATIEITFGPQGGITWLNPAGQVISTSNSINNVPAGNYTVMVDDDGCGITRPIYITEPTRPSFTIQSTQVTATAAGTASITPTGGSPPFTYAWYNETTNTLLSSTSTVGNLHLGVTYNVCLSDSCGNSKCQTFIVTSAGFCGDMSCNASAGENCVNCAKDCASPCGLCGDGSCGNNENCINCTSDCASPCGLCGDGTCSGTENCVNCVADCGQPPCNLCGDGVCAGSENCISCSADCASPCGLCGDGTCSANENCINCTSDCAKPCGLCGDGTCSGNENCLNCASDCASPCGLCGDGQCSASENCTTCASDCGSCPSGSNCAAGFYLSGTKCVVCPPGSYNQVANSASCTSCPINTYTSGGNTACKACQVSYYSAAGSAKCTPCPIGQARNATATSCSPCPAGTSHCGGTVLCQACPAGTASNTTGVFACPGCNPGYYQPKTGQMACVQCPVNTYSPLYSTACVACPSGTKSPLGSTNIAACT